MAIIVILQKLVFVTKDKKIIWISITNYTILYGACQVAYLHF